MHASEAVHLIRDPLAVMGVVVMLGGLVLISEGLKKAFSEKRGNQEEKPALRKQTE